VGGREGQPFYGHGGRETRARRDCNGNGAFGSRIVIAVVLNIVDNDGDDSHNINNIDNDHDHANIDP
jgi:hypothetical protein